MAQTQRQYDFQPGTKALSAQVDGELDNLVQAHNTLDDDVQGHKAKQADSTSTDITKDKHISNEQSKKWEDHANSTSNPHGTTATQVGAYSKTEANATFETITNVNNHKTNPVLDHPNGSVTTEKLANNAVNTVKIADFSVSTSKIADLNVTTEKIADLSVTTAKIVDQSITRGKIAPGAVGANEIDSSLTTYVELNTHKSKTILDHPDKSVTYEKLSDDVQLRFTSIESDIGDPTKLTTTNKESLVGAVNELKNTTDLKASQDSLKDIEILYWMGGI